MLHVWASDDGSTDATRAILQAWQARWGKGRFEILSGPRQGFAGNFRYLVQSVETDAAYYAYCDQDDIWLPGVTFKGLTAERLAEYKGPLYGLFETEFGTRMIRAEERIRAVAAEAESARLLQVAVDAASGEMLYQCPPVLWERLGVPAP